MKTCEGSLASDQRCIIAFDDAQIVEGVTKHADPEWWKEIRNGAYNIAYLRRWGTQLRREARRRGIL